MRGASIFLAAALACALPASARAVEGAALAGPIGGTDIRVAYYPPPGLYGGLTLLRAEAVNFVDGGGNQIPGLESAHLYANVLGPFLAYIPDVQVLGGSIGVFGTIPLGQECGRYFATTPERCVGWHGDPYVEIGWSRSFATPRQTRDPGAYPVMEGLAMALSLGAVFPVGQYSAIDSAVQGISMGNNIGVLAPALALSYTTRPLIADGTEFSAKVYWNMYRTNPDTGYQTGDVINIDFAVTERFGRVQVGPAGFYAFQIEDDKLYRVPVAPDGRRGKLLNVGGVMSYDIPSAAMLLKVKILHTVLHENMPSSPGIAFSLIKKLQ